MPVSLERNDIIAGLRDLVAELSAAGEVAGIRIVGGAALALRYFDRGVTRDVDTLHVNPGSDAAVAAAAERVASRRDWDATWLNFEVTNVDALPTLGRAVEWETIADRDGVVIQVASPEALLAMKLRANRPGRDTRDNAPTEPTYLTRVVRLVTPDRDIEGRLASKKTPCPRSG